MGGRSAVARLALALVAASTPTACDGCGADETLAELVERTGEVRRDRAATVGAWEEAGIGARFSMGDGVRTGSEARAVLDVTGARLSVEPSTEIRFEREGAGRPPRVDVTAGAATLEAVDAPVTMSTSLGTAVLERGARVRLEARPDGPRLAIELGTAVLEEGERSRRLVAGDVVETAEPAERAAPPPPATPPPTVTPSASATPPVTPSPREPSAPGVDLTSRGAVERREGADWVALAEGAQRVGVGTRIRLSARSTVSVVRGADRVELSGRGEHVVGAEDGALVETVTGRARVVARDTAVIVRVPGGTIVATVDAGAAEARVVVTEDEARVDAVRGRVRVERGDEADAVVLAAGERTSLRAPARAEARAEARADAPDAELSAVDLTLRAGEDAILHVARPPVAVRFDAVAACGESGAVEIGRRRAATHRLAAGTHRYRVRCDDGRTLEGGRLVVLRDSGRVRLPSVPPTTIIDADGRRYTVLYQNQLPSIRVRWPGAPERGPYTLRFLEGGDAPTRQPQPAFTLPSGRVREGSHRFVIEAGERRSPETHLAVRFDNAAATASVREPSDQSFASGETVRVSGVVLREWSVAVDGRAVELDAQSRFDLTTRAPSQGALVIRVAHPRRGAHYYLRRPRGAS